MCALPLTPPGDKGKQQQGRIPVLLEVMLSSSRDNRAITGRHNDGSSGPIYRTSVKPGFVSRDPPRHLNHLLQNAYLQKEKLALLNSDLTPTEFCLAPASISKRFTPKRRRAEGQRDNEPSPRLWELLGRRFVAIAGLRFVCTSATARVT